MTYRHAKGHNSSDRPTLSGFEPSDDITVTPAMIDAGVLEAWPEPKPPGFIGDLVERIYRAMERVRQVESASGVSARRQ